MIIQNRKLTKRDTPKGWTLEEGSFRKKISKKPILFGYIWLEQDGRWRPKIEFFGNQSYRIWSKGQQFGPDQKSLEAAVAWVKRAMPAVKKRVQKALAAEEKRSRRCEYQ